jgi:hypothetical protein
VLIVGSLSIALKLWSSRASKVSIFAHHNKISRSTTLANTQSGVDQWSLTSQHPTTDIYYETLGFMVSCLSILSIFLECQVFGLLQLFPSTKSYGAWHAYGRSMSHLLLQYFLAPVLQSFRVMRLQRIYSSH